MFNQRKMKFNEERLIEVMKKNPRISYTELAKTLDMSISTVYDYWMRIKDKYGIVMYNKATEQVIITKKEMK